MAEDQSLPEYTGKILLVALIGDTGGVQHLIENPRCEELAKRIFLVGTVPTIEGVDVRPKGKSTAIAWDQVRHYQVFDTPEEARDYFRGPTRVMPEVRTVKAGVWRRLFGAK